VTPFGVLFILFDNVTAAALRAIKLAQYAESTLAAGTIAITLPVTPVDRTYTGAGTYVVLVHGKTVANAMFITYTSGTAFSITSSSGADTQVVRWFAIGY
jgi:hypothetical protein